jgi:hypothetical protein
MRNRQLALRQVDFPYPASPQKHGRIPEGYGQSQPWVARTVSSRSSGTGSRQTAGNIKLADHAIREQLNLAPDHAHYNPHDLQAMQDALRALSLLQRSALRE